MRDQGATFFLLDGRTGWRTADVESVSVGERDGIRLAARPEGPLALTNEDGSLGGVVLPRGMAFDGEGTLYLLGRERPGIRRFDPERRRFVQLASVGEEVGSEVRQFRDPANITIAERDLYVADRGNRRVQVFALGTLAVRHVWGPRDGEGRHTTADDPQAWEPADVAAQGERAYILDRRYGRVYVHRAGTDRLKLLIEGRGREDRWTRIAVDREGRIYLLDQNEPEASSVEIYDGEGRYVEAKQDAGDIRDRFAPPPFRLYRRNANESWRFCLPESLMRACDRRNPFAPPLPAAPMAACASPSSGGLLFNPEGERVREAVDQRVGPKLYAERGEWWSEALDSQVYRCQWHRIILDLYELPAGARVEVYTYTDAEQLADVEVKQRPEKLWSKAYSVAGQIAPPKAKSSGPASQEQKCCAGQNGSSSAGGGSENRHEFLVQSREGQYLWLKILLFADGYGTPAIRAARVHYPRDSYLAYLPAVYSADDESRWFLERFLSIFQTEWDALEQRIEDMPALFDPKAVPSGQLLEYLASWFALPLEGTWNGQQKRRLLEAAIRIYFGRWKVTGERDECLTEIEPDQAARRGTREGLRRYLQVYLQNMTCISPAEQGGYPQIVEGFRERQRLMVSLGDTAALACGAPLWGPSAVGRLHLGEFAREGEVRLVSTGDPEHEIFQEFAHRFRVFVPSSWVRDSRDEEMLRRALDEEKPAHTVYDLCLVEPRFRVGLQSTIGVDTIVGAHPVARLACTHDTNIPPSRPPRQRLGYDTILAARTVDPPTFVVGERTRAGIDTILN